MYRITERPNDWVIEKENVLGLWEFVVIPRMIGRMANIDALGSFWASET